MIICIWARAALGMWLTENIIDCFVGTEWEAVFHEIHNDACLDYEF